MRAIKGTASKLVIFSVVAAFLVTGSILYSLAAGDGGTPVTPNNFYGTFTIDGSQAATGTRIIGMVGGEDKTDPSPYTTQILGEYGCYVGLDCKFGVNCTQGQDIIFSVEVSPGNFVDADQTGSCNPGDDTNLDLTVTTGQGPVCGNGNIEAGEQCESPFGLCCDSQTCQFVQGTECRASSGDCDVEEYCTGQSADCPADEKAPFSTSCDDGLFCSATDHCDGSGNCIQLTARDCSANNTAGIATCTNTPDSNPFTWDFRVAFTSVCNEGTDSCTAGSQTITHTCSKASCSAPCETVADCNDGNASTTDACLANCTCQHIYQPSCGNLVCDGQETCSTCPADCGTCPPVCGDQTCNGAETCSTCPQDCGSCPPVCGNGNVEGGETCELPSTSNNPFCSQSASQCSGHKLGVRDAFGNCNVVCGCIQDQFDYSCVAGECSAQCSVNSDCNDGNVSTVDTCLGDCMCQYTAQGEYCIVITSMRVLNVTFDEDSTIPSGTMYNIEMSTYNNCDHDVVSMQIVQVLNGMMPVNLGTVISTIQPAQTSTITVGFIMPNGTPPDTQFTANGFNWNHWIDQSPETFEILSDTSQVGFQSQ